MNNFLYTIQKSTDIEINNYLNLCKDDFIPSLDLIVDINNYAHKIHEKSITFETWDKNNLIGLVACYVNDINKKEAYITNVNVLKYYHGMGIAKTLLQKCINYVKDKEYQKITLEVNIQNHIAKNLYLKLKFSEIKTEQDSIIMELRF